MNVLKNITKLGLIAASFAAIGYSTQNVLSHADDNNPKTVSVNTLINGEDVNMPDNTFRVLSGNNLTQGISHSSSINVFDVNGSQFANYKILVGSPYNSDTNIFKPRYDEGAYQHDWNILKHLADGVTDKKDAKNYTIHEADLPSNVKGSKAANLKLRIVYHNAVSYAPDPTDMDSNGNPKRQKYNVEVTYTNFHYYPRKYWGANGDQPKVFFNDNFGDGIWFEGITRVSANIKIIGLNWNPNSPAYLSVNGQNGLSPNAQRQAVSGNNLADSSFNLFNNAYIFKHISQDLGTYQRYYAGTVPTDIRNENTVKNNSMLDMTGRWSLFNNGRYGYVYDNTDIGTYYSKVEKTQVSGGLPGTPYNNSPGSSDYYTHSIVYRISDAFKNSIHNDSDGKFSTVGLTIGSGIGYGNIQYTTKIPNPQPNVQDSLPVPEKGTVHKSVDKTRIHKQGEEFTYKISGYYPKRELEYKYYKDYYNHNVTSGGKNGKKTISYRDFKYKKQYVGTNDYFNISDDIPSSLSIESINTDNINVNQNGNHISSNNNYQTLLDKTSSKNRKYTITIKVKADRLNQPDSTGWHDDGPSQHGMYHIKNTAHVDQRLELYQQNNNIKDYSMKSDSETTTTDIQRWQGVLHHYDFDNANKGDFSGFDINWQGDNFENNKNYNGKNLRDDQVFYGYEGDTKSIAADNSLRNDQGNKYNPYVQSGTVLFKSTDDTDDNAMVRQFYMPYYLNKLKNIGNMVKIDTDKAAAGLPFHMYQRNESYLFKNITDYSGINEKITVKEILDNGQEVDTPVFQTSRNVSDMIAASQHGAYWWNIDSRLTNLVNPSTGNGAPKPGQKINFIVRSQYSGNPDVNLQLQGNNIKTYGFIASESEFNNKNFDGKDFLAWNPVERTIAYNGADQIRELREGIRVDQSRVATAKTGYGMKNDFKLEYAGWNNVNNLKVSSIKDNANINFVFPKAFADNGLDHDKSSIEQDAKTGFKNSDSAINYNAYNNINPLSDDEDGSSTNNFLQDRLEPISVFADSDQYNPNMKENDTPATLDTFNNASSDNVQRMQDAKQLSQDDSVNQFDESVSSFNIGYRFYKRIANFGANLPNGVIGLADTNSDPEASNKVTFDSQNSDGGYRFYTPYWLSLKTDSKDGNWPTYWERTNHSRFGANFFEINDRRPIKFYGHMYLANNSKSDQNDELSIQPLMTAKQIPNGFTQAQVDWLKKYATFK